MDIDRRKSDNLNIPSKGIQVSIFQHNSLNNASEDWFRPITKTLTHISMSHNPWICDSRMCGYKNWTATLAGNLTKLENMTNVQCWLVYFTWDESSTVFS